MNITEAGRPAKHRVPWGDIRLAWERGEPAADIAARYQIPRGTIYARVHYHEWPNRARGINRSRVDFDLFERLWSEGVRTAEIAERLGVALSYVGTLARRLDLPRRPVVRTRVAGRPMPRHVQLRQPALQLARCEQYLERERATATYPLRRCEHGQLYRGPACGCAPERRTA